MGGLQNISYGCVKFKGVWIFGLFGLIALRNSYVLDNISVI